MDIDAEFARLRALNLSCIQCGKPLGPCRGYDCERREAFIGLTCDDECGATYHVVSRVEENTGEVA